MLDFFFFFSGTFYIFSSYLPIYFCPQVVDMVASITAAMAMEEITVEVPRLTGGATKLAFNIKDSTKQANMETTCNLARLYLV